MSTPEADLPQHAGQERKEDTRLIYLDYLRVFATIAVICIHVSGLNWSSTDVNSFAWQVYNFYDSISRWAVPAFVMISGTLFLGKGIGIRRIYTKYVLRIVTAFLFWSLVYALLDGGTRKEILDNIIQGHYHMWFLFTIVGLYICLPILDRIAENRTALVYFLALAFVFTGLIPEILTVVHDFGGHILQSVSAMCDQALSKMNFHLAVGYSGYFVGGFYLSRKDLSKRRRLVIYGLGFAGFASTVIVSSLVSISLQQPTGYYGYFSLNVLAEITAVFVWCRYNLSPKGRLYPLIKVLSKYSFGAYLVHALVLERVCTKIGIWTWVGSPVLTVAMVVGFTFALSVLISALLNHIPVLKNYIV